MYLEIGKQAYKKRHSLSYTANCTQFLYVIKFHIPNNRKDDSNDKEEKTRYKNTAVILLFGIVQLTLAVIGISLVLCSAHRNKCEHGISDHEADTDQSSLATDIQHARKKRHQYTRNEESI